MIETTLLAGLLLGAYALIQKKTKKLKEVRVKANRKN